MKTIASMIKKNTFRSGKKSVNIDKVMQRVFLDAYNSSPCDSDSHNIPVIIRPYPSKEDEK